MRQRIGWAMVLALIITPSFAQDYSAINREHTQWIASVLRSVQTIKPGMKREQLLRVFTTEGGTSTRLHRTYVYKQCLYIKVSVEFIPVGNPDDHLTEMPGDEIRTISRPFLQYAIVD
jgi:hypothetical protein